RRLLVLHAQDDEAVVGRLADAKEQAGVRLLIDEGRLTAARETAENLVGAAVRVSDGPEYPLAVGRQDEIADGGVDRFGGLFARRHSLGEDLVALRALIVLGVGEQGVIRRRGALADLGVALVGGQDVGVQLHLFAIRGAA